MRIALHARLPLRVRKLAMVLILATTASIMLRQHHREPFSLEALQWLAVAALILGVCAPTPAVVGEIR